MAFYFGNKLKLEVEDKEYVIDISSNKVINAVREITEKSIELSKKEQATSEEILGYIECNKQFVSNLLGSNALDELFKDKAITYEDIGELSYYILEEIGKFKNNRISKYSSAPNNLN